MPDVIEIQPSGPLRATIRPPGSKSITIRALVCAALADGETRLTGALDCEDTQAMICALRGLGVVVEHDPAAETIRVVGCGEKLPDERGDVFVANSGATARFLTAVLTLGRGTHRLDGSSRMQQRPVSGLLEALGQLGADAVSERGNGCLPVVVRGRGLRGGRTTVAGNISSQFLSALLLAAPQAESDVEIGVREQLVSRPYVEMTLAVMAAFGVEARVEDGFRRFTVRAPQRYCARRYAIEPDASAASYFLAAAAITQGDVTIEGLSRDSLQGDVAFCECLRQMGCQVEYGTDRITVAGRALRGIEVDMNGISDTVPTLCAVALFAVGATTIRGVAHIRHKETDRIAALAAELRKFGAKVEEFDDGLRITPLGTTGGLSACAVRPESLSGTGGQAAIGTRFEHGQTVTSQRIEIETYGDHRVAMSMALVGLAVAGVAIRDPGCVAKTYPRFFQDLNRLSSQ
jgi:3-phosphoshikimate 1-carboxyvinyltransferase